MKGLTLPAGLSVILLMAVVLRAENIPTTRLSLKGLEGMAVEVAPIAPDAARAGLSEAAIRSAVESRLRKAGIRIFTPQQSRRTPRRPSLHVNVATSKLDTGEHLYSICLEVTQWVALLIDPKTTVAKAIPVPASTWSPRGCFGIVPASDLSEDVGGAVDRMADEFIDAYRQANPAELVTTPLE